MASGEKEQMEMETLAQRLEFCSGSELLATLEELEAMAASRPDLGQVVLPALFALMNEPSRAGAEATQQAVEVVSRLVSPSVSLGELGLAAAEANITAFVSDKQHAVILLDLLESDACETYTLVVALELLTAVSAKRAEGLRAAVLAAPAGAARLVETLSDRRDEVRNSGVQLWERLTRPTDVQEDSGGLSTADELRTVFAFNDGFAKLLFVLESANHDEEQRVMRDAAKLVANVLAGPPLVATMFQQSADKSLRALERLLRLPDPALYDDTETDEEQEGEETQEPRPRPLFRRRRAALAEALANAAASLTVLWRLVTNERGGVAARQQAQSTLWNSDPIRLALLTLGLDEDLDAERLLLDDSGGGGGDKPLIQARENASQAAWWAQFACSEDFGPKSGKLGALRQAVRVAALEIITQCLIDNESNTLDMCEATFQPRRPGPRVPALRAALMHATRKITTNSDSVTADAARRLAETTWAPESAATIVVMHAVTPPPALDDEIVKPALEVLVEAIASEESTSKIVALGLLRRLLGRSPRVRELALNIPGRPMDDDDDSPRLLATVFALLFRANQDRNQPVTVHALASVCCWLRDNSAAAHALLRDPNRADGLANIARSAKSKRAKGLAALALGLCLENFGDEERAGWTKEAVSALVGHRVGLGAFAFDSGVLHFDRGLILRGLDALQEDIAKSAGRRRFAIAADDVFAEDENFANFVTKAAESARRRAIGDFVEAAPSESPTDVEPSLAISQEEEEDIAALKNQRAILEQELQRQADEIARTAHHRDEAKRREETLAARIAELEATKLAGNMDVKLERIQEQASALVKKLSKLLRQEQEVNDVDIEANLEWLVRALPEAVAKHQLDYNLLQRSEEAVRSTEMAEAETRCEKADLIERITQHAQLIDELTADKARSAEQLSEAKERFASLETDLQDRLRAAHDRLKALETEAEERHRMLGEAADERNDLLEQRQQVADASAVRIGALEVDLAEARERASAAEAEADKMVDEIASMQDRMFQAERRARFATDFDVQAIELLQLEREQLKEQIKQQAETLAANAANGGESRTVGLLEQRIHELQNALDEAQKARTLLDEERLLRSREADAAETASHNMENTIEQQATELAETRDRLRLYEERSTSEDAVVLRETLDGQRRQLVALESETANLRKLLLEAEQRESKRLTAEREQGDITAEVVASQREEERADPAVTALKSSQKIDEAPERTIAEIDNRELEVMKAEELAAARERALSLERELTRLEAMLTAEREVVRQQAEARDVVEALVDQSRSELSEAKQRALALEADAVQMQELVAAQRLLAEQNAAESAGLKSQVESQLDELAAARERALSSDAEKQQISDMLIAEKDVALQQAAAREALEAELKGQREVIAAAHERALTLEAGKRDAEESLTELNLAHAAERASLEAKISQCHEDLAAAQERTIAIEAERRNAEESLAAEREQMALVREQLKAQINMERDELAAARAHEVAQRKTAEESLAADRDQHAAAVESLQAEIKQCRDDLDAAQMLILTLEAEKEDAEQSLTAERKLVQEVAASREALEADVDRQRDALAAAEASILAARDQEALLLNPKIEAYKLLPHLQDMLEKSDSERSRLAEEVASLSALLGDAEAQADARVFAAEASFAARAAEMESRLAASEEKVARYDASREAAVATLETELGIQTASAEAARQASAKWKERVETLTAELEAARESTSARIADLEAALLSEKANISAAAESARRESHARVVELQGEVATLMQEADSAEEEHERELQKLRSTLEAEMTERIDEATRLHDRELEEFEREHAHELEIRRLELEPALDAARVESDELRRQLAAHAERTDRELAAQIESRRASELRVAEIDLACVAAEERAVAAEAALDSELAASARLSREAALAHAAATCADDALSSGMFELFEAEEATRALDREASLASLDAVRLLATHDRTELEHKIRQAVEERDSAVNKAEADLRAVEARVAEVDLGVVTAEERACSAEKRALEAETKLRESQDMVRSLETSLVEAIKAPPSPPRGEDQENEENGWGDEDVGIVEEKEGTFEENEAEGAEWKSRALAAEWRLSSLEDELHRADAAHSEEIESLEVALEDAEATAQAELESRLQIEQTWDKQRKVWEEHMAAAADLQARCNRAEERAAEATERALFVAEELAAAKPVSKPEQRDSATITEQWAIEPSSSAVEKSGDDDVADTAAISLDVAMVQEAPVADSNGAHKANDKYRAMLQTGLPWTTVVEIMVRNGAASSTEVAEAMLDDLDAEDGEAVIDDDVASMIDNDETMIEDDEAMIEDDEALIDDEELFESFEMNEVEEEELDVTTELARTRYELAEAGNRFESFERETLARSRQLEQELEEARWLQSEAEARALQVEDDAEAKLEQSDAAWEEQRAELDAARAEVEVYKSRCTALEAEALTEAGDRAALLERELADARQRAADLESKMASVDSVAAHRIDDLERALSEARTFETQALAEASERVARLERELTDARQHAINLEAALRQAGDESPRRHNTSQHELERLAGEVAAETRLREELERRLPPIDDQPPHTPEPSSARTPTRFEDDDNWLTARAEESLRDLEDEHNDLLALLAQQELEKEVLATYVRTNAGEPTLLELKHQTQSECVQKYGVYVEYDGYDDNEDDNGMRQARTLALPFDAVADNDLQIRDHPELIVKHSGHGGPIGNVDSFQHAQPIAATS